MRFFTSLTGTLLLLVFTAAGISCSIGKMDDVKTGEAFLSALRDGDFQGAADLSTDSTAGIVLFMGKMMEANKETGEELQFPVPAVDTEISLVDRSPGDEYTQLRYHAGSRDFQLQAVQIQGRWLIDMPREYW